MRISGRRPNGALRNDPAQMPLGGPSSSRETNSTQPHSTSLRGSGPRRSSLSRLMPVGSREADAASDYGSLKPLKAPAVEEAREVPPRLGDSLQSRSETRW